MAAWGLSSEDPALCTGVQFWCLMLQRCAASGLTTEYNSGWGEFTLGVVSKGLSLPMLKWA